MLHRTQIQTWWPRLLLALAPFVLPVTASAANWVQVSTFNWIDADSIVRSGNVTAYTMVHAVASPATTGDPGTRSGIDCNTGREYWDMTGKGQLTPVPDDDPDFDGYMSATDERFRFLCPQQAAAAAKPKPSATPPANPAPTAPAKVSDLKLCQDFRADEKARIAACTRIIESKNPGFADLVAAHTARCQARFAAKEKVDDALTDCTRAMTLDPKNFDAVHWRAAISSVSGRYDAAIADFTIAIALNPKDARPHYNRALAYLRKKDLQKALADFAADHALSPGASEAFYRGRLCWARTSLNVELETALGDCERAVRLAPKNSYAYSDRALVRLRMGNLNEARADTNKAAALDKKNAAALYLRALVNAREGKSLASHDDYAAAKKILPDVAVQYDKIGLKLIVQAETAPFCPALTALIKAVAEHAASNAKIDIAMPGATHCKLFDRGGGCTWETGAAQAKAKQQALASAAAACLAGYTRSDEVSSTGPTASFVSGKTKVVVGTSFSGGTKPFDAAAIGVVISNAK